MRTFAFLCLCVFVAAQAIGQTRTVSISVLVKDSRTDGVVKGAVVKVLSDGKVLGASVTSPMGEAYFTVPISITSVRESEAFCPGSFILSSPYPNPSDGPVSMGLQIPVSGRLDILVYNVLGEVVYEKRFHTPPGGYILSIDLKGLADGLYLVQARSERETKVRKFLKIGNAKSGFSVQPSCMMVPSGERGIVHVAKRVRTSDVLEFVAYTDVESRVKVGGTWSDEVAGFARDTVEVRSDTTVVLYLEERPAAIYGNYKAPVEEVRRSGRKFMVGQVGRYAPGFRMAKHLIDRGEIGELFFVESEYAHDYRRVPGVGGWRKDPMLRREPFLGGGCHPVDLLRWIAGDPHEVFAYANHKALKDWPVDDCTIAIFKFPQDVLGKVLVSIGCRRPYTMRSVFYGDRGTIIADNTSPYIQIYREDFVTGQAGPEFAQIPVNTASHNVQREVEELVEAILQDKPVETDVVEGAKTVAACLAAVRSTKSGRPEKIEYPF